MGSRQTRWVLVVVATGLVGLLVLFAALIHESTGHLAQGVGGGLAVVALPLGWVMVGSEIDQGDPGWWRQMGLTTRVIVVLAIVSLFSALLVDALSRGSIFMGAVLVATIGGGLALADKLIDMVGRIAYRYGSPWGPTLLEGAVIVASLAGSSPSSSVAWCGRPRSRVPTTWQPSGCSGCP